MATDAKNLQKIWWCNWIFEYAAMIWEELWKTVGAGWLSVGNALKTMGVPVNKNILERNASVGLCFMREL